METSKIRVKLGMVVMFLALTSSTAFAGITEKFNKYIGSEFTNMSGLYIILGVFAAGLIGKLFHYFFIKDTEEIKHVSNVKISPHRHHRHRPVVKKTS